MNKIHIVLITSLTSLVGGCAFTPQQANLDPHVSVMRTSEGAGITVAVKVIDERPSKSLGRRGTAYGAAAEITSTQELAAVVYEEIVDALKAKGFSVEDYSSSSETSLKAEIRLLEYSTSQGFWTGGVHVNGAIKVFAAKAGKEYDRIYRTEDEKRVVFVPDANSNEEMINTTLSTLLNQIFEDRALLFHLSN